MSSPSNSLKLTSYDNVDVFTIKLNSQGNFLWAMSMGGSSTDWGGGITLDIFDNVYVTGQFYKTAFFSLNDQVSISSNGYIDSYVFKLKQELSIEDLNSILIYPNPTSDILTIDKKGNSKVNIILTSSIGKHLDSFSTWEPLSTFNISNYPSGLYLISLSTSTETVTKKIIKR